MNKNELPMNNMTIKYQEVLILKSPNNELHAQY